MKKTGQLLRETREKKGISLNAVAASTKINLKVLEAIENGEFTGLPSKTFVRGFVQTYATYLKIDVKSVMEMFQEEVGKTGYTPAVDKKEILPSDAAALERPGSGLTKWFMAGLALLLFVAIYFVSQTVQKYKRESEVPPTDISDETILAPTTDAIPEATEPVTTKTPDTTELKVAATPTTAPEPAVTAIVTPMPEASIEPNASPSAAATPTPDTTATPSAGPSQTVTIEALDTVQIEYQLDDGPIQTEKLEPEQKKKFSAKHSFTANISDGGAVNVILNGKDKGVPGNLGQPLKLSFPPKD